MRGIKTPRRSDPVVAAEFERRIELCRAGDRHRLRRRLRELKRSPGAQAALERAITASILSRERRGNLRPVLNYPSELPVSERRMALAEAIAAHQVVVVCGATGSGKTTQLPKICLELGRGIDGLVGHTQPRRLAARTVAARIAEEMNSELGTLVGFHTRFHKQLGDDNLIKVMTDGILLAEIQRDRWLNDYDTIILDEAHERSLNIDFLFGYLKQLLAKRRDLKLIVTSATLEVERIAAHFDGAPVLNIEGRGHPVDIRYRPLRTDADASDDLDVYSAIDQAIDELQAIARGDVLVFLPGEREIRDASKALRHRRERFEIHPLYARLSPAEQQRIFRASARPRIILSTNVAETSLTVPGIRYVIDSGTARISRYSWRAQIQRLPVEKISRASAAQRAGRCGRTSPGICIRLYSEDDFAARPEFTQPEIQRTNLAAVILQMAHLRLGAVERFPFIDPPDPRLVRDGYRLLHELQAVDAERQPTPIGNQLVRIPLDPRLARMLVAGAACGSLREVAIVVSALTAGDPRERPFEKQQAADAKHARFVDKRSDFAGLISLWRYLDEQAEALSQAALRRLCAQEFISFRRWREWRELYRQVVLACRDAALNANAATPDYAALHRALLTGLLDHIGFKDDKGVFIGSRNRRFYPFPGSALRARPPQWIMAAEITETSRVYARTLAGIEPQWIEDCGSHLLRREYSEPHWQRRRARITGYEKLLLNGLVVHPRKPINYAEVDPVLARELFIRHALVRGEWDSRIEVLRQNRALIESVEVLEARTRRRDIGQSEEALYDWYARRVPASINSGAGFSAWARDGGAAHVVLRREDVVRTDVPDAGPEAYPGVWAEGNARLPLDYRFEPGAGDDGVSVKIPLALLHHVDAERCEWLVPGMLEAKIVALLRALPKRLRKHFIPVPEFARAARDALTPYDGNLCAALGNVLLRMTGFEVPQSAWHIDVEPHLKLRFAVYDDDGRLLASGRDLAVLTATLERPIEERPLTATQREFERECVGAWDFGALPVCVPCVEKTYAIDRYPALADENGVVALRLFDSAATAAASMRDGVARLITGELRHELRYLDRNLPHLQRLCLMFSTLGSADQLKEDLWLTGVARAFLDDIPLPRDEATFHAIVASGRERFVPCATGLAGQLFTILELHAQIRRQLSPELPLSWIEAAHDIERQLEALIYPGFLRRTPPKWLDRLPRYLRAIQNRIDKLDGAPDRDRLRRAEIEPLCERVLTAAAELREEPGLLDYRWLLEELRVSLFAQELGALEKVSVKRLDKLWASIGQ